MLTIYSALNLIAGTLMFVFSGFLYQGSNERDIKAYSYYAASTAAWGLANALYLFIPEENYPFVLSALRLLYATGIPTAAAFCFFSLTHKDSRDYTGIKRLFIILSIVQLAAYVSTDTLVRSVSFGEKFYHRIPEYNWTGFALFNIAFSLITTIAFVNLWQKWHKDTNPESRAQTRLLFWAGIIAWWPPIIMSIILPLLGNFDYYWIAPTTTSLWVVFTSYGIFRHRVFRLRVIPAVLLIILLLVILFLNIFIADPSDLFTEASRVAGILNSLR